VHSTTTTAKDVVIFIFAHREHYSQPILLHRGDSFAGPDAHCRRWDSYIPIVSLRMVKHKIKYLNVWMGWVAAGTESSLVDDRELLWTGRARGYSEQTCCFSFISIKNIVAVHLTTEQRHTSLMSYAGKSGARVLHACFTVFQDGIRGLCEVP